MSKKGGNNEKQEKQRKLDWIDLALKEFKDRVLQAELDRQIDEIKGRVIYSEATSALKN